MSNIKNSNNYITLQSYNDCSKEYKNNTDSIENFGSFSLYAAVRPPYNANYFGASYFGGDVNQPIYPGVN